MASRSSEGRLTPESVLYLIRDVTAVLRGGREPREALIGVTELLVPEVAGRATVYALDNDGRLHVLGGVGGPPAGPAVADERNRAGEVREGNPPDRENEGLSVANHDDHPVALACRNVAVTWVSSDGAHSSALDERPRPDDVIREVAIPLLRDREAVAVLDLAVDPGVEPGFDARDVELLSHLGDRLSLSMESVRLRRDVETARQAKADFLAVMSHELRTPLTAVVGYADLMEAGIPGPVTERQCQHLERIKDSAWELLDLIDGILDYARHEGDDPDLLVSMVEPRRVLDEALAAVRPELHEKGLSLSVEVEEDLPALRTDRSKAVAILRHILSNATKFTDTGEVRVRVRGERDWLAFEVIDSGPGIAPSTGHLIFEPFWQGEKAETRTKGGTGMGLSMARRLAELLSAEIQLDSEEGVGSTFTLRLPWEGPHPTFA